MSKRISAIIIIIIAIGLLIASYVLSDKEPIAVQVQDEQVPATTTITETATSSNPQTQVQKPTASEKKIIPNEKTIAVSFVIRGNVYSLNVKDGSTGFEAMQKLASSTNVTFHASKYPSLGYFIDEINGIKNSPKANWIYYVNGKEANVGIAAYILKAGDSINWRYENSEKQEVAF